MWHIASYEFSGHGRDLERNMIPALWLGNETVITDLRGRSTAACFPEDWLSLARRMPRGANTRLDSQTTPRKAAEPG